MSYHVYVNKPTRKATLHYSYCSQCNYGEGVHEGRHKPGSYWLPDSRLGFATFEEAMSEAKSTGMEPRICKNCYPD
jgi:hypothetical protein